MTRKTKTGSDTLFAEPSMKVVNPPAEPKSKSEVAVQASSPPPAMVPNNDFFTSAMQTVERLAVNKDVDVEKLDRATAVLERMIDRNAKVAYDAAMSAMQPYLPVIDRRGLIEVRAKDGKGERTGAVTQSTRFGKWEDINEAIKPILHEHGFALTFRVSSQDKIVVTGIVSHRVGHREETSLTLPHDSTGSKNAVQAVGSSISYGKRYVTGALLNITTREEDDDGRVGGGKPKVIGEPMTPEQVEQVIDMAGAVGCSSVHLLKHLNSKKPKGHPDIGSIDDLPAARFDEAIDSLRSYEANKKEREAKTAKGPAQ